MKPYALRVRLMWSAVEMDSFRFLAGFHTFDYARHFLSCCSRMLGVEHLTSRGSILLDFYGRYICVKIMPTGVNPKRFLDAFSWSDTTWRLGELKSQVRS